MTIIEKTKRHLFTFGFLLIGLWCFASSFALFDGHNNVSIKVAHAQSVPKTNSIQASINGHLLSVVFLENLGDVIIEITTNSGAPVETLDCVTPNGMSFYIYDTGSYIVTFYLPNGDEYYGEFDVTN